MTNSYFKPILNHLKTTDDVDNLALQIDHVIENIYKMTNISINQLIDQNLSSEIGAEIKRLFLDHALSFEHHEEVKSFFRDLKEELTKCKIILLTVAYHLPQDHLDRLKNWSIKNMPDDVVFKIQYDPELLAGAVVILDGNYIDHSLKSKLDTYFANQQNARR